MPLLLAFMVVVIALQVESTKQALNLQARSPFALFAKPGLIASIGAVGRPLDQVTNQHIGGFEDGGAHQNFQFLHEGTSWILPLEARDQLLDFLILGQEDFRSKVFFFATEANCSRVSAIT